MLDVGVHGAAAHRPGADERHLDGEVVEVLGARLQQALHLGAALDLEHAHRVGVLDLGVDRGVGEADARQVDALAARGGDQVDALLDGREHPQPEQVDLHETRVGAGVLVPLADLPPGEGGRDDAAPARSAGGRSPPSRPSAVTGVGGGRRPRGRGSQRAPAGRAPSWPRRRAGGPAPPPRRRPTTSRRPGARGARDRPRGRASAEPSCRMAMRMRKVGKAATSAACSGP